MSCRAFSRLGWGRTPELVLTMGHQGDQHIHIEQGGAVIPGGTGRRGSPLRVDRPAGLACFCRDDILAAASSSSSRLSVVSI
jgi:hypothetical protein